MDGSSASYLASRGVHASMSRMRPVVTPADDTRAPTRRLARAVLISLCAVSALSLMAGSAGGAASADANRPARSASVRRCLPPRGDVLRRSGSAVLFVRQTGASDGKYGAPHSLFGCSSSRQARRDLFDFEDGDQPTLAVSAFTPPYAAFFLSWAATSCVFYESAGAEHCGETLFESANLSTGRVRLTVEQPETAPAPRELVVTRVGWIAWTAWTADGSSGAAALMTRDSAGERKLDPGPIDAGSLKLSGETVRWSDAGVAHTAVLR